MGGEKDTWVSERHRLVATSYLFGLQKHLLEYQVLNQKFQLAWCPKNTFEPSANHLDKYLHSLNCFSNSTSTSPSSTSPPSTSPSAPITWTSTCSPWTVSPAQAAAGRWTLFGVVASSREVSAGSLKKLPLADVFFLQKYKHGIRVKWVRVALRSDR